MKAYIRDSLAAIEQQAGAEQAAREAQAQPGSRHWLAGWRGVKRGGSPKNPAHRPLIEQVSAWLAALPPVTRHQPRVMADMLPNFAGRYQAQPSARELAQVLRVLGWRRVRNWRLDTGASRNVWLPPARAVIDVKENG